MGKYSNHHCTSLAASQVSLPLGSQLYKHNACWYHGRASCRPAPLEWMLHASPKSALKVCSCRHAVTERRSRMGQSPSFRTQPASVPLPRGNGLVQFQGKHSTLSSSLAIPKKSLQQLTPTSFPSSEAEDQS